MKLFGSISELVSAVFRKNSQTITLRPNQATTYTAARDIQTPAQDADSILISRNSTDTLTNKSISGSTNTITNVSLTTGVTGILPTANGGTGQNSSATFPTSGVVVTEGGTETLQNKTIDNTNTVILKDTLFTVQDDGDITKQFKLQLSGITTGTTRTLTVPDASDTIVVLATSQSLTNKNLASSTNTLTGATAGSFTNTGTVTLPTATTTLVGRDTTDTLTNKTLTGNTAVNLVSGSGTLTLNTSGTVTLPNATDTLVGKATTDTLTNKTLTAPVMSSFEDFTEIATPATPSAGVLRLYAKSDDNIYIKNSGGTETQLVTSAGTVTLTGTQTLTNKSLVDASTYIIDDGDNTKKLQFQVSGVTTGTTRTITVPDLSGDAVLQQSARLSSFERNFLKNSNFDIWQQGTSFGPTTTARTADMFVTTSNFATALFTTSQDTSVPTVSQSGFSSNYSMKIATSTSQASPSAGEYIAIQTAIEGYDYENIHAQAITVQFWVKSTTTGTYSLSIQNSAKDRAYVTTYAINSANTWELKTLNITLDSSGTWLFTTGIGMYLNWILTSGSTAQTSTLNTWQSASSTTNFVANTQTNSFITSNTNTWQIAQVMVIPNSLNFSTTPSVPYRRAGSNYQAELALCQRYLYRPGYDSAGVNQPFAVGQAVTANAAFFYIQFPVPMRTQPGLTTSSIPTSGGTSSDLGYTSSNGGIHGIHEGTNSHTSSLTITSGAVSTMQAQLSMAADADRLTAGDSTILARGVLADSSGFIQFSSFLF